MLDISNASPERLISVAERSVLSQHFVNGTEESVESIVGISKRHVEKPLSYGEFKSAVRRRAEYSQAPTHEEFMNEVSDPWKALRYGKFKSIGLSSFKKAQDENHLTLYHELQEDEYFRKNPDLINFKKKNYVDPDVLAARRAGKTVHTHDLIQDRDYNTFGRKYQLKCSSCSSLF